jgi:hypothetical protein
MTLMNYANHIFGGLNSEEKGLFGYVSLLRHPMN